MEVAELDATTVMIGHFEIRGAIANFEHLTTSADQLPGESELPAEGHARIVVSMSIEKWNERYRSGDFEREPSSLLIEAVAKLTPRRALDLACGAGRNAIYLAERGWNVVAIDASVDALRLIRDPRIELRLMDLERQSLPFPDDSFDLVCLINFLHLPLFAEAKRVGRMIVTAIRTRGSYSIDPGELRAIFSDWQVLIDRDGELVARRPSS